MLFSDHFKIDLNGTEDWFDPLLSSDIKLFIDPFLIFEDEFEMFEGSHKEIIEYYEHAFNLVAKAAGDKQSAYWTKAISVLSAPEVEELCLGFTDRGTGGAGTGKGKARLVAEGLEKAVLFGLTRPEHFETVQLFREKIGPDTISDTAANILRMRLAKYTEKVCQELSIPMKTIPHPRAFLINRDKGGHSETFPHRSIPTTANKSYFAQGDIYAPFRLSTHTIIGAIAWTPIRIH